MFQLLRKCVVDGAGRFGGARGNLQQHFASVAAGEWATPRQQFVKHDPKTEEIALTVYTMTFPASLFGTAVGRSTGVASSLAGVLFPQGQSKIRHMRITGRVEQNICRLDVPMKHTLFVGIVQRVCDDRREPCSVLPGNLRSLHAVRQRLTLNVLADDIAGQFSCLPDVVHRHNSWMIQPGHRPRFPQVDFGTVRGRKVLRVRNLDGYLAIELFIVCQIDGPKRAATQHTTHPVATDLRGGLLCGRDLPRDGGRRILFVGQCGQLTVDGPQSFQQISTELREPLEHCVVAGLIPKPLPHKVFVGNHIDWPWTAVLHGRIPALVIFQQQPFRGCLWCSG